VEGGGQAVDVQSVHCGQHHRLCRVGLVQLGRRDAAGQVVRGAQLHAEHEGLGEHDDHRHRVPSQWPSVDDHQTG
jgi:hypothetical protein